MGRRFLVFVLGLLAIVLAGGPPCAAQGSRAPSEKTAEQELRQVERDRFAAMVKRDAAVIDKLLAPELIYTHGDGRVIDKATFIAELKSGDFQYVTIEPTDVSVRVFGDAAVVTGGAGMHVINKGVPAQIKIRYTNTQVRRSGSWQMVAWQATRLAQ
ncbi:MAG: nuclear transport factor 2 family protein [Vicinamibacterales bacterium]|nr:nuclear transport factor 2 family protein [Vicinamibacterales bacterium]